MLTEQERKWLELRKYRKAPCGEETHHCVGCLVRCGCSLTPDLIDAAEFEARVAEKLTLEEPCPLPENADLDECPYFTEDDGSAFSCRWCRLKRARIAVEEEMDNGKDA